MPFRPKGKAKPKSNAPSYGWQNVSLVERDEGKFSGYLNITPEFLDEIADRIENGTLELDEERNTYSLGITIRDNENQRRSSDAAYLGNVYLFDTEEEEKPSAKKRTTRNRRRDEEEEEEEPPRSRRRRRPADDDEDEPPARSKRRVR